MSIRSIDEIIKLSDLSKNPEKIAYKKLVKQLDPQIKERAKRYGSFVFRTPVMLWGSPVFDHSKVEKKLIKHYRTIGFDCYKLKDGDIVIRWRTDIESDEESSSSSDSSGDELDDETKKLGFLSTEKGESDSESEDRDTTMNVIVGNSKN